FVGRGRLQRAVGQALHAPGNAEAAVHVDPLVLAGGEAFLDLFEVCRVVDFAEVGGALLCAHADGVDGVGRAGELVRLVDDGSGVPDALGLVDRERLEYLDVVAEDRQVGEDVDVHRLGRSEVE